MNQQEALVELEKNLNHLIKTPFGRRALLISLPSLLAGCASGKKSRYREGDNSGQNTSVTVADEIKMANDYKPKMLKEYPPVNNRYAQSYINELGQRIVQQNGLHKRPYTYSFTLVNAKMVNAFALPAGSIYVTTPLLKMAQTEAELAGVVGHEIGHVKARHTAERIDAAKKQQTKSILFGLGGALLGGAAGFGLGKLVCKKNDRECLKRVAIYGGVAGGAGGLLISKFAFMANSREDEMEADRIGFKTAMKAGFHPNYVGNFYSKLLEMEKQRKKGGSINALFADALSTHPPGQERVAQMNIMIRDFAATKGQINSSQFKKVKGMV